ncbi:hypothetical protein [Flavobacterium sp. XGLA_31]|uniref:hypothetical protein n=1 Tax=Flavobacterium sp. XGLA_31 TaxID=3447666 RepID=UPI003F3C481F
MKTLNQLMQDVISLTTEIETNYPELYKYLSETPIPLGQTKNQMIHAIDLEQYLETLKTQLQHHIETHHKEKNNH